MDRFELRPRDCKRMLRTTLNRHANTLSIIALIVFFSVLNYQFAKVVLPIADLCQSLNELPSIWQGNYTLEHWELASDNFYFTDLPMFVFLRVIFGFQPWLLYLQPVIIYALLTSGAIWLVASNRPSGTSLWPGTLAILYFIGLPFAPGMYILLSPDIHIATIAFCLYALVFIRPCLSNKPINAFRFFLFMVFAFAASASDPLAQYCFILPLCLTILFRGWLHRSLSFREGYLFLASISVAAGAVEFPFYMVHNHGFLIHPTFDTRFVSDLPGLLTNCRAILLGLQKLFIADPLRLRGFFLGDIIAYTRLFAFVLAGLMLGKIIGSMPRFRERGIEDFLAVSCCCVFLLVAASADFTSAFEYGPIFPGTAMRYITPIFVFLALIAAIKLQELWSLPMKSGSRLALKLAALVFGLVSGIGAAQGALKAHELPEGVSITMQLPVVQYLTARHLAYGVGDYWTANLIPFLSKG